MAENPYGFEVGGAVNQVVGPTLASAATIAPTYGIHHVSGTTQINTITLPWAGFAGPITLIPDGNWSLGTSGNIQAALTAILNSPVIMQYDGTKWYNVSGAAGGGGAVSVFRPFEAVSIGSQSIGVGTLNVVPFVLPTAGAFTAADIFVSNSYSATNAGSSQAVTVSATLGVYTASGSSLSLASSGSVTYALTVTGSTSSVSFQGLKALSVPITLNMTPGNYWYAPLFSTASAGNAIAAGLSLANVSYAGAESAFLGVYGQSSAATQSPALGLGQFTVSTGALPASIAFSQIQYTVGGNTARQIVQFKNYSA